MAKFIIPKPGADVTVWWPATINVPQDDGTTDAQALKVRFQIINDEALQETLKEGGVHAVLKRVVVDWEAKDDSGAPVSFDRFEEISAIPYVRQGLFDSYIDCSRGYARKN